MSSADKILTRLWGGDPVDGASALDELVSRGNAGEDLFFLHPISFPETFQARRRALQYVASRESSIADRLVDRIWDHGRFRDGHTVAYLFAGIGKDHVAIDKLYPRPGLGPYSDLTAPQLRAWGHAGREAGSLLGYAKHTAAHWERQNVFAFRSACATVARARAEDFWVLEQFVSHSWEAYSGFKVIDSLPNAPLPAKAITYGDIWDELNYTFTAWRRGELADELLRRSSHEHWRVRELAAGILARLGFKRTVTPAIKWLAAETVEPVRGKLLYAIERSNTSAGADELLEHCTATSTREGVPFFARIGWRATNTDRAIAALLEIAGGPDNDPSAAEALVSLGRLKHRHPSLSHTLDSRDAYRRQCAALAVAYLGELSMRDTIVSMRREAAGWVERLALAAAAAMLGAPNAGHELCNTLRDATAEPDFRKRVDVFLLNDYLQAAIRDGLAASAEVAEPLIKAWQREMEPFHRIPEAIVASAFSPSREIPARARRELVTMTVIDTGESAPSANAPAAQADILLITVNEHETRALLDGFAEATGKAARVVGIGDRIYRDLGTIQQARVFHALSEMGAGGLGGAQQTVAKGISALDPWAVIAVGIAFGIDEKRQSLGEILLSEQVQLYDLQRRGASIITRGDKPHASPRLINYFKGFAQTSWRESPVRTGLLLTGEKLVDNLDYRKQLTKLAPDAIGGEMEGAGMYVASQDAKVDWIIIKAICDWADGNKALDKTERQRAAARNAAGFLLHAIRGAPGGSLSRASRATALA